MLIVRFGLYVYLSVSQEESAVKRAFDVLYTGRNIEPVGHLLAIICEEAVQIGQGDDDDAKQCHQHAAAQYGRQQLHGPSGEVYVIPHIL